MFPLSSLPLLLSSVRHQEFSVDPTLNPHLPSLATKLLRSLSGFITPLHLCRQLFHPLPLAASALPERLLVPAYCRLASLVRTLLLLHLSAATAAASGAGGAAAGAGAGAGAASTATAAGAGAAAAGESACALGQGHTYRHGDGEEGKGEGRRGGEKGDEAGEQSEQLTKALFDAACVQ
ncbi:unnamed protein product, partial [Closterium sp. NIES-54]